MDRATLAGYLEAGLSLGAIAERTGKSRSTVSYHLRKFGLKATGGSAEFRPRGGIDRADLEPLVMDGATLAEIARRLGCSVSTVRYWIAKHGLPSPIAVRRGDRATAVERASGVLERRCRVHGKTAFVIDKSGRMRCRQCRMEAVNRRRRKVKELLVQEAGGRCCLCGYDAWVGALQFHHLDPGRKEFALSGDGVARSLERARAEAAKCVLLCANCHAEVEAGVRPCRKVPSLIRVSD